MSFNALKRIFATYHLTRTKLKLLVQIVLLGAWALIQFSIGNKFYGVFIIVFFLILVIPRQPPFILVAVSVLVIVLFNTPMIDSLNELRQSNLNTVRHLKPALANIFTPNSGQEALPIQVQQMVSLLRTQHATSYRLSDQIASDPSIVQRITESAWPIKMEPTSSYRLISLTETNSDPACVLLDQREDVALVHCP